jgi:two-component system, OmpR family, alkaline phosphatase synthesis response regulator PhoP
MRVTIGVSLSLASRDYGHRTGKMDTQQQSRPKVLIAEDDHAFAAVLEFVLGSTYEAMLVNDGESAWRALSQQPIDLLISDYQMPVINGIELCRRIRNSPEICNLPIVMITAKGFEIEFDKLEGSTRPDLVFVKPFSPKGLLLAMQSLLAKRMQQSALAL